MFVVHNFSFLDAPFNAKYYVPGNPETEATYMGCRTRVIGNVCGPETVSGRGNLSFTTINLPRLGIIHGCVDGSNPDIDGFFKDLDEKIDLVIDQLLERMEICRTRVIGNVCGPETVSGRGNLSFTTINLPRLGIIHGCVDSSNPDIDGFFKDLDEKIDLVIDQLLERMEIQGNKKMKNFPFLMGQGVWMCSDELGPEDELEEVIKPGYFNSWFYRFS